VHGRLRAANYVCTVVLTQKSWEGEKGGFDEGTVENDAVVPKQAVSSKQPLKRHRPRPPAAGSLKPPTA